MADIWGPNNPGIGGLDELTTAEEAFVQNIAGLSYTQGDILYYDGTNINNLGPGTSGDFLKTQGAGANPLWATVAGGGTPGGSDTQVQFNDGGAFGANAGFTFDKTAANIYLKLQGTADTANSGRIYIKKKVGTSDNISVIIGDYGLATTRAGQIQLWVGSVSSSSIGTIVYADNKSYFGYGLRVGNTAGASSNGIIDFAGSTSGVMSLTVPVIAGTGTLTLPVGTDTLVGKATTDTLTNKTLSSLSTLFEDTTDPTRKFGFSLSGIAPSSTRTITLQNSSGTMYISGGTDVQVSDGGTGASVAATAFSNLKQAASTIATGVVELATIAETDTGTDATRSVSPDGLAGSYAGTKNVQLVVFDFTTNTAIGDGKFYFHVPASLDGMNLVAVHAEVITAGTTGTTDIQIHNVDNVLDMLSTKLTIDSAETGSDTAATAAVINTSNDHVNTNDVLRIDVDAISTTAAKGLIISLDFRLL